MTTELALLLWSVALLFVYLFTQAGFGASAHGVDFTLTPRDQAPAPNVRADRASRALRNFHETYAAFIALILVANFAAPGDSIVYWGALAWLVARLVYLPLYITGVVGLRSAVWMVALAGLVAMFIGIII